MLLSQITKFELLQKQPFWIILVNFSNFTTKFSQNMVNHVAKLQCNFLEPAWNNYSKHAGFVFCTAQKMKFSIKNFFSKCDHIRRKLQTWSNLLKKSLMENFIFCAVLLLYLGQGVLLEHFGRGKFHLK